MKKGILATKVGMTQIFNEDGVLTPVTVLLAGPCVVTQVKTAENDGYNAVQVGFVDKRAKLVSKPLKGHFDKAGVSYKRYVREFKFENASEYSVKDESKQTSSLQAIRSMQPQSPKVKVSRVLLRDTDSPEDLWLMVPNSIVMQVPTVPVLTRARYSKGKKMPGQMGNKRVTIQNLEIVKIDAENNLILVKGAVPGPKKSLVTIKETVKAAV